MKDIEFLIKQHHEMFNAKKEEHKAHVLSMFQGFIADRDFEREGDYRIYGDFYLHFAENCKAEIYERELLVGNAWFWRWQCFYKTAHEKRPHNNGHFAPDYRGFLERGIVGQRRRVEGLEIADEVKSGWLTSLDAFALYIKKYAKTARELAENAVGTDRDRLLAIIDNCENISENPPATFMQALQLVLMTQNFLLFESGSAAIALGKLDTLLYPIYKKDIDSGVLTREEAMKLVMCFYIKLSEGDESCMLTVGGDDENELTTLFMDAQTAVGMIKPSITLRVSDTTSSAAMESAARLAMKGSGMPAFLNDNAVKAGFRLMGVTDEDAIKYYSSVGCYEPVPEGYYSNTVAKSFNLYDIFDAYLEGGYASSSFEAFVDGFRAYFGDYYANGVLPQYRGSAERELANVNPFCECMKKDHKKPYFFGLNILGIGVLIDSFYVIKKLVFEEKYTTVDHLRAEAKANFTDTALYARIAELRGHYGSNTPESNALAREISELIGKVILENRMSDVATAHPALFLWSADIRIRECDANINGRRRGELFSYGIMPCATPIPETLTSLLMSCANIASEYFPDGCPAMVQLNRADVLKDNVVAAVIRSYFAAGGFHLAVNVTDAEMLKRAKKDPSTHADLQIKISGYSERFTRLDGQMQDSLIERCELY